MKRVLKDPGGQLAEEIRRLQEMGFDEAALKPMRELLAQHSKKLAYDPAAPYGGGYEAPVYWQPRDSVMAVQAALQAMTPGPTLSLTGQGPYTHVFSGGLPSVLAQGIELLRRGEWEAMCQHVGLGPVGLTFDRAGSLGVDRLRWQIVRQSDGQGLTGSIDMTYDPRADWELLVTQLQDALEALSYMPEGPRYIKGA